MKYWIPEIRSESELPSSMGEDRFGGLPWGLSRKKWPKCKECGSFQTFVAQFSHHPERLDLGREGRILYIFMCNSNPGQCSTWDGKSGANKCFVLEPEEIQSALSSAPEEKWTCFPQVQIAGWIEKDDGISSADEKSFFKDEKYWELDEETLSKVAATSRLGSVPTWIQSPSEAPRGKWKFVGQIDSGDPFLQSREEPKKPKSLLQKILGCFGLGSSNEKEVPSSINFGDEGVMYLFVQQTDSVPKGHVFWQCH